MGMQDAPPLAGVYHLKLPVTDLDRSRDWYSSRLGYDVEIEFIERGKLMGYGLEHPNGGPALCLRLDPGRARAAAGFDYFALGVCGKEAIDELAARLSALGEGHAGVHFGRRGWILLELRDPDGHEVRFFTIERRTDREAPARTTLRDVRENFELAGRENGRQPACAASPVQP